MVIGDKTTGIVSVVAGGFMEVRPDAGVEWVIHNVYHADSAELHISDGTNSFMFDFQNGQGAWLKYAFQMTNGHFLKIKNTGTDVQFIAFDGVVTK